MKIINVLDNGFIRLVDTMGDDASIVQAARVSYGKGTKSVSDDEKLIRYLMRNNHTSPFEMAEIKFHVRVPMDTWRQWIRHRTASVNEYSTRYSEAIDAFYFIDYDKWRSQSNSNKQGSGKFLDEQTGSVISNEQSKLFSHMREVYRSRIDSGVAREIARKDLPLSTYTEAYWKIDLKNLLHFLRLRLDDKAQFEIRQYAIAISRIVAEWVPITWAAFVDYQLESITFSKQELGYLSELIDKYAIEKFADMYGGKKPTREAQEFIDKLTKIK